MKLELGRLQGGQSLTSRLSFRAKLLLVLFVPFLALVVVAAAGLSDRFTDAARAGAVRRPLGPARHARLGQPRPRRTRASCRRGTSPAAPRRRPSSTGRGPAPTPRSREFRLNEQAFANAGLSPTALAALDAANRGLDQITAERDQDRQQDRDRGRRPGLLPRGRRRTSSTSVSASPATSPAPRWPPASPVCSRSSGRSTSTPGRPASTSRCSPAARPGLQRVGRCAGGAASSTSPRSATPHARGARRVHRGA